MLKARILTALILIPLVIASIFLLPPLSFFSVALLLMLLAGWEWSHLAGLTHFVSKMAYLILLAAGVFLALYIPLYMVILLALLWWAVAFVLLMLYPKASQWWGQSKTVRLIMGFLVLIPFCISLIVLQGFSPLVLMYCLILIWGVDSVAYFVGRRWGKHKLAPSISPGKTYEGLIGGLLAAAIISAAGFWTLEIPSERWLLFFVICMIGGGLISVFGDLFESMLKRQSQVKDSGSILPGHGGLLDRIDSLTTAIPFFALVFSFFFNY